MIKKHPIKLAFAVGANNEFGYNGGLPWGKPLAADMQAFREFTAGCVLVMGHGTFKSLPSSISDLGRECVVISTRSPEQTQAKDGSFAKDYFQVVGDELELELYLISEEYNKPVCVIGGANLVEKASHIADEIMFTTVHHHNGNMKCDVKLNIQNMGTKRTAETYVGVVKCHDVHMSDKKLTIRWLKHKLGIPVWYK